MAPNEIWIVRDPAPLMDGVSCCYPVKQADLCSHLAPIPCEQWRAAHYAVHATEHDALADALARMIALREATEAKLRAMQPVTP